MHEPGPFEARILASLDTGGEFLGKEEFSRKVAEHTNIQKGWKQRGLSSRAAGTLTSLGISSWDSFAGLSAEDVFRGLHRIGNCGAGTCREIIRAAEAAGIRWADLNRAGRVADLRRQEAQLEAKLARVREELAKLAAAATS